MAYHKMAYHKYVTKNLFLSTPCSFCSHKERCGREFLACKSFSVFVETGRIVRFGLAPTRKIYLDIFPKDSKANFMYGWYCAQFPRDVSHLFTISWDFFMGWVSGVVFMEEIADEKTGFIFEQGNNGVNLTLTNLNSEKNSCKLLT